MGDFLTLNTIHLPSFGAVRGTLITHIRDAFLLDSRAVNAPAFRCLERALKAAATGAVPSDGRGGTSIFSGGDLEKDVGQVRGDGCSGGSARQSTLMTILKGE
jgi:hypothetical protein